VHHKQGASPFSFEIDRTALKDAALVIVPLTALVVAAFWLASLYIKPAPPDSFVLSTGAEGGAYHIFGQRYRDILARDNVRVELRASAGSIENLQRLLDPASGVEVAFVQAGVASPDMVAGLASLGAIAYEPLWIFYRDPKELAVLNDFAGKRIAVGPEGSGTRALSLQLLRAVGALPAATLEPLGGSAAAEALIERKVNAAFIVASTDAPVVRRLIQAEGIKLLSLDNAEAFARRFPFLTVLTLPRGVVDLAAQLPRREVKLLATTANIVVRADFHPALAYLLLNAAHEIHGAASVLQRHQEFPAAREAEIGLRDDAQRYFKSGPPFLRRYLPFWLANLVERALILLLPLFAVLVPALKILPGLWQWRVKMRVFRWYGEIKLIEQELTDDPHAEHVPELLERLDEIERGVDRTRVPKSYADYVYNLRTHIDVVRRRVTRVTRTQPGDADEHEDGGTRPAAAIDTAPARPLS
jgi:TRAP transporter TAXI family solute receptor